LTCDLVVFQELCLKEEKVLYLSCCKCRLKNGLLIFPQQGAMSRVLYKSGQFNREFILGAGAASDARVQTLAVEHQTQSQGNITCSGNPMRAVSRLPCDLHKRSPLY